LALPEQLLLSDVLRRRVHGANGEDQGAGVAVWMHPPVHRVLGWVTKPAAFGSERLVWRLNQLRGFAELEALVQGDPSPTDQATVERLPTLIDAALFDRQQEPIGIVADAAIEFKTGRILHYLVSRSDPRLPGSSRWRLSPDRIVDQQPAQVFTALQGLDDLPLAKASVRQEFLRRSRRWRDQVQGETARLRDQFQQVGDRFEERVEGWLEEPPWEGETWERESRDQGQDRPARPIPDDEEMGDWPEQPQDRRPRSRDYGSNDSDLDPWI
jgi:hypothetical protein